MSDPEMSVVLKLLKFLKKLKFFRENQTGNIEIQKEQYTPKLGGKCSFQM